jgi:flagellar biosynthetic protein FlhB
MAETSQERTEQATDKRKREARKKGTVAKSVDLNHAASTIALLMTLPLALSKLASAMLGTMRFALANPTEDPSFSGLQHRFLTCLVPVLPGIAIIMAVAVGVALVSNFAQVGLVFSPEALAPNFAKMNPLEGFKRMLSSRGAFETGKAALKAILFGYLAYSAIMSRWSDVSHLGFLNTMGGLQAIGEIMRTMALRIAIVWAILAGADYYFQRKQTNKGLMMSKQEVKQEHKESEGSPEVKMARHRRRHKLRRQRMRQAVQAADVVVTNPTHFAVAIQYSPTKGHAPIVVAKGQDLVAARIREFAKEAKVPIVANPPLARALHKQCEVGDFVPRELFQAVAEVLAYVYKTLGRVRR